MTAGAGEEVAAPVETMDAGPSQVSRRSRLVATGVVALLLVGGSVVGWRAWLAHTDLVSSNELHTAYTAVFGSRDHAVQERLARDGTRTQRTSTLPVGCGTLIDALDQDHWPADALERLGASRDIAGETTALVSYRYPDRLAATNAFDQFAAAANGCHQVKVGGEFSAIDLTVKPQPGRVADTDAALDVVFISRTEPGTAELAVARYKNVLSWSRADLSETTAGQGRTLLQALSSRLTAVDHIGG